MANVSSFSGAMPVIPGGTVELGYTSKTSTVPINVGSGAQASVIGPLTVVCDGSPIMVEFFCEEAAAPPTAGAYLIAALWVDGAETTRTMGVAYAGATGSNHGETLYAVQRITPSAGSHTIEIKGWSSAAANFYAGAGGTASYAPMWLRVSKIVNQNDGLKPFWTPPVVTQLPSQATVGDQVIYAADATNGVYWHLQYDGLGTYPWKFIGGPALVSTADGSGTTTSTTYTTSLTGASNAGPSLTIALPGDYDVAYGAGQVGQNTSDKVAYMAVGTGTPGSSIDWVRIYTWATNNATYFNRVDVSMHASRRLTGLAGASTLAAYYKVATGATATFGDRYMNVTPVRVKAA